MTHACRRALPGKEPGDRERQEHRDPHEPPGEQLAEILSAQAEPGLEAEAISERAAPVLVELEAVVGDDDEEGRCDRIVDPGPRQVECGVDQGCGGDEELEVAERLAEAAVPVGVEQRIREGGERPARRVEPVEHAEPDEYSEDDHRSDDRCPPPDRPPTEQVADRCSNI